MPDFSYTPKMTNDRSTLTPGWHPACLVAIADEETPPQWQMAAQSPRLWRWQFAVWEAVGQVPTASPEMQSAPTSQKFSPGGKVQASKAYVFTRKLLGRVIEPGEHINLDTLMPLPCQVLVARTNKNGEPIEFANISDLQPWPEGAALVTPSFKAMLATWLAMKTAPVAVQPSPAPTVASPPLPATGQSAFPPVVPGVTAGTPATPAF